jgi:hypothetical protein
MENNKKDILRSPETVELSAPGVSEVENKIAFRRAKVRELMRMGYNAQQISIVLKNGIKLATGETITLPSSEAAIKNDISAILEEEAAYDTSKDISSKKADIQDKLNYLYNQAIREYREEGTKGIVKNSFLNTALSVLKQQIELNGLTSGSVADAETDNESKVSALASEVTKLGKEDSNAIIGAIRQVLGKREQKGSGDAGVSDTESTLPA